MSAVSENTARLIDLERRWHVHMAAAEQRGLSDEEIDANCDAVIPVELKIAAAPCDSMDALMVKLRTVVRHGAVHGRLTAIDDAALIDGMIAYLESEK